MSLMTPREEHLGRTFQHIVSILATEPDAEIMGIEKRITTQHYITLSKVDWVVGPLDLTQVRKHRIPRKVFNLMSRLIAKGIQFPHFIWGDELKDRFPTDKPRLVYNGEDLYWVEPHQVVPPGWHCLGDPLLIGLVDLKDNSGKWLYVKLGEWYH